MSTIKVSRSAADFAMLAIDGLDQAGKAIDNDDAEAAVLTLLAGILTGVSHQVILLEAIAKASGVEIAADQGIEGLYA